MSITPEEWEQINKMIDEKLAAHQTAQVLRTSGKNQEAAATQALSDLQTTKLINTTAKKEQP